MILLLALLVGVVAGLRAMTAPAITSWAARLGWLSVGATPFRFMGGSIAPFVFAVLALAEIANDKRASTPARTAAVGFVWWRW